MLETLRECLMWGSGMEVQKVHRDQICHKENQDDSLLPHLADLRGDLTKPVNVTHIME